MRCEKCNKPTDEKDIVVCERTGDIDQRFGYRDVYLCRDCQPTVTKYSIKRGSCGRG